MMSRVLPHYKFSCTKDGYLGNVTLVNKMDISVTTKVPQQNEVVGTVYCQGRSASSLDTWLPWHWCSQPEPHCNSKRYILSGYLSQGSYDLQTTEKKNSRREWFFPFNFVIVEKFKAISFFGGEGKDIEIGSHSVAQVIPELMAILLPQSSKFWEYRHELLSSGKAIAEECFYTSRSSRLEKAIITYIQQE